MLSLDGLFICLDGIAMLGCVTQKCCDLQLKDVGQLPGWGIATCSAGSAALAAWCTHPADVVKTRLQVSVFRVTYLPNPMTALIYLPECLAASLNPPPTLPGRPPCCALCARWCM